MPNDNQNQITAKRKNYSRWYSDIIMAADLAEHAPVKGCMIIKPYGYAIWENIKEILDKKIKESGAKNAYFPLFIPEKFLKKEKEHIEGFSPEVAVVTFAGGKKLKEALIIRPTSETIINYSFSRWVKSQKDLPLLINQWVNVVRWELRPRLFLRTTEFLWQEGHTAHSQKEEADDRARMMLEMYKDFLENYMAIPVIVGKKSETEKFAGALHTYTLEAMMQDGKALQVATSHNLGQNFAKAFNIQFSDIDGSSKFCWQTSWGMSTRVIGGLIMTHSDDGGLILPPRIAPIQIIILPIWYKEKEKNDVKEKTKIVLQKLQKGGFDKDKIEVDFSDKHPGEKFYYWERKGVPLRIEIGPRDVQNEQVVLVRRDTKEKENCKDTILLDKVTHLLEDIQNALFKKALSFRETRTKYVNTWQDFKKQIRAGNFVSAHWCGDKEIEKKIKQETKATIRCIPFENSEAGVCIFSGKPSKKRVIFARSY